MSSKNQVQEYYQQRGRAIPHYETHRVGGADHAPEFSSTFLHETVAFHATASSKKAAELRVAEQVLSAIQQQKEKVKEEETEPFDEKAVNDVVFIDAENVDVCEEDIKKGLVYHLFMAKNTTKKWPALLQQKKNNVFCWVTESTQRDAADFYLVYILSQYIMKNERKLFHIVTKDHYGSILPSFHGQIIYHCSMDELRRKEI